ncbi:hypothetical protein SmJEL517_g02719 [Synchytrium microbalum]|uniref:Iron-binding zinc finger CDGSH type domain-containing protein n=1 Tax=Synchytrium microbalum TaxID=1806994 RepID=A0A507C4X3_9FUNG|nr:uncharacterized protein SmJEL517_g02719 [Synchytrium microbalum]TPX34732.1 hypothetical protein SmJEL517_g02719 [Synchytrium microbalum]
MATPAAPAAVKLEAGKVKTSLSVSTGLVICNKNGGTRSDGSHKGTEFKPKAFKVEETKDYYLCGCKLTGNAPFCDGTHRQEAGVKRYNEFLLKKNTELKAKLESSEKLQGFLGAAAIGGLIAAGLGLVVSKMQ